MNTLRLLPLLAATALLGACGGGQQHRATGAPVARPRATALPVVVDYSPTLSDVSALLALAARPDVDLRAVTLAGTGESRCSAAVPNTLALLELAGRDDVPVACGRTEPIGPGNDWPPAWRDAADKLAPLELADVRPDHRVADSATGLLAGAAADAAGEGGLVVVALGPLTNLADTVAAYPRFADEVAMVWSMGGAIGVPGNAPGGHAEWNYYVDPTAADRVFRSGLAVTVVPLDATNHVPANYGLYRRLTDPNPNVVERTVLDLWTGATPWQHAMFLWDELTAVLAADPALAPVAPQRIGVVTAGAQRGRTVPTLDGVEVLVVGRPDRVAVETAFLDGLAALDR